MADKEVGDLTTAGAISGAELAHIVQSGNSRKATLAAALAAIAGLTATTSPNNSGHLALYDTGQPAAEKITPTNLWKVINQFTGDTGPNGADVLALYEAAGSAIGKLTLANLFRTPHQFTSDTGPNVADELSLYAASEDIANRVTLANLLKVINQLTADASPDSTADYVVTYDASADAAKKVLLSAIGSTAATQADQEAVTSTTTFVSPARQHFNPSAAKCWAYVTVSGGTPTLAANYNITSITDGGVGILTITIATDFSSSNWAPLITVSRTAASATVGANISETTFAAGSVSIVVFDAADGATAADPAFYGFVGFGDQ